MTCWGENNNPVVILVGGVATTLTASQEFVTAGTVQIANNSEAATAFPEPRSTTQTQYIIPPKAP